MWPTLYSRSSSSSSSLSSSSSSSSSSSPFHLIATPHLRSFGSRRAETLTRRHVLLPFRLYSSSYTFTFCWNSSFHFTVRCSPSKLRSSRCLSVLSKLKSSSFSLEEHCDVLCSYGKPSPPRHCLPLRALSWFSSFPPELSVGYSRHDQQPAAVAKPFVPFAFARLPPSPPLHDAHLLRRSLESVVPCVWEVDRRRRRRRLRCCSHDSLTCRCNRVDQLSTLLPCSSRSLPDVPVLLSKVLCLTCFLFADNKRSFM